MRTVRCVSPHGGAHNGLMQNGDPAPPGFSGSLKLPANPGGWVWNAALGHVAVGSEVDAPDDFTCDGFHFIDVATGAGDPPPPPPPPPAPASPSLADLLSKGDS